MKKPIIIGIAGGSASGKTSVARKLVKNFDDDKTVAIIRQDDYYRDQSHMPFQERLKTNYDHPDAFDNELLIRQIDELASGKSVEDEEIRNRLDMKIFIDTDADIRFIRRLKRDVRDRGRTIESVCDQYMNTVRVMHEAFVEPSKRKADVIIPEGSHNEVAMDLLLTKISSIITSKKSSD